MKTIFYSLFFALLISCASNDTVNDTITNESIEQEEVTKISEDLSATQFKQELENNPGQLIDVRTPEEFADGFIEGATNINFYDTDFEAQLDQLDQSKPVYVYCKSGGRSGQARSILSDKGFNVVYNLVGGYSGWKN